MENGAEYAGKRFNAFAVATGAQNCAKTCQKLHRTLDFQHVPNPKQRYFQQKSSTAWQADASEATLQGGRILVFNIRPLLCTVLCNNNGKVEVLLERISK